MTTGPFIKAAMATAGISTEALAVKLGTTRRQVVRWRGGQWPRDYVEQLADALGISAADLHRARVEARVDELRVDEIQVLQEELAEVRRRLEALERAANPPADPDAPGPRPARDEAA